MAISQCFRDPPAGPGGTRCGEGESNLVRFGVLSGGQTSLITADTKPPLPAGTYYVHIAGHDAVHNGCPQIEFSDIVEVTIGPDGSETSSRVVAPGTGECTLIRGSGGSAGGGVAEVAESPATRRHPWRSFASPRSRTSTSSPSAPA